MAKPVHRSAKKSKSIIARAVLEDLAAASRILVDQGVFDAAGHVSMRHPGNPRHFLMSRSLAPQLVTAGDIMEFDLDCVPVDARGRSGSSNAFCMARSTRSARCDGNRAQPFGFGDPLRTHHRLCVPCITTPHFLRRACRSSTSERNLAHPTLCRHAGQRRGSCPGALRQIRGAFARARHGGGIVEPSCCCVPRHFHGNQRACSASGRYAFGGPIAALDVEEGRLADIVNVATVGRSWDLWKRRVMK